MTITIKETKINKTGGKQFAYEIKETKKHILQWNDVAVGTEQQCFFVCLGFFSFGTPLLRNE